MSASKASLLPSAASLSNAALAAQPSRPDSDYEVLRAMQQLAGNSAVSQALNVNGSGLAMSIPPSELVSRQPVQATLPENGLGGVADAGAVRAADDEALQSIEPESAGARRGPVPTAPAIQEKEKGPWADLRDRALRRAVREIDDSVSESVTQMRGLAQRLPPELYPAADTLISIFDAVIHTIWSIWFFLIGTLIGFVEGLVDMIVGVVMIIVKIFLFLVAIFQDLIVTAARAFGHDDVNLRNDTSATMLREAGEVLVNIPSSISKAYDEWAVEYRAAPPEIKASMLGRLFGQVLAVVATSGAAATRAAQLARVAKVAQAAEEAAAPAFELSATGEATASAAQSGSLLGPEGTQALAKAVGGSAPVAAKAEEATRSSSQAKSQKRVDKLRQHAEKQTSYKKNKNLRKEVDPFDERPEPRESTLDDVNRDPTADEIVDEADRSKGSYRKGEGAAVGTAGEAEELTRAWLPEIEAEGYTEIYRAKDSFSGSDWLRRTFTDLERRPGFGTRRRGGPDFVAINRKLKRILVGDVTSEFQNTIPEEFGSGDRLHIEKTIEDGTRVQDVIKTIPELADFVVEVQERYWRTGQQTKRIRIRR